MTQHVAHRASDEIAQLRAENDRLRALNAELVATLELIIDDVGCGYTVRELTKQMLRAAIAKAGKG